MDDSGRPMSIGEDLAIVKTTDEPYAELSISSPSIADISSLSDRSIYILGRSPGYTTLTTIGVDGRETSSCTIAVVSTR